MSPTPGVLVYKGIPYAAPPVGTLRWHAPADVIPWEGVRSCKACGPNPMQGVSDIRPGELDAETVPDPSVGFSEDCLYLNVWCPEETQGNLPVVFYIPGGAWVGGGCSVENYNGEYLATQNIIFVSINYRLGIFGWFAAEQLAEEDADRSTGNYGFMDIIKALEWTRDNIAAFGGDPDNITLYGGSAGGNLIDALMVSPKAKGLFHRAYSVSFPLDVVNPFSDLSKRLKACRKIALLHGGLDRLRAMPAEKLQKCLTPLNALAILAPCIDGSYLDVSFMDGLREGRSKEIPYITGLNYNEAHSLPKKECADDSAFIRMMAGDPKDISMEQMMMIFLNAAAKAREEGGARDNTYTLLFEHCSAGPVNRGAVHGGDLNYMIRYFSPIRRNYWKESDYEMGDIASAYFIQFCRTGDPNGTTAEGKALTKWEPCRGDYTYFAMDNLCETRQIQEKNKIISYLEKEKKYTFL